MASKKPEQDSTPPPDESVALHYCARAHALLTHVASLLAVLETQATDSRDWSDAARRIDRLRAAARPLPMRPEQALRIDILDAIDTAVDLHATMSALARQQLGRTLSKSDSRLVQLDRLPQREARRRLAQGASERRLESLALGIDPGNDEAVVYVRVRLRSLGKTLPAESVGLLRDCLRAWAKRAGAPKGARQTAKRGTTTPRKFIAARDLMTALGLTGVDPSTLATSWEDWKRANRRTRNSSE